jgi:hypothetical protein
LFNVEVCLNGREWLARQMDRAGMDYEQRDNCFARVSDPVRAQALLDEQLKTDWPRVLDRLLEQAHPLHAEPGRPLGQRYYWSASQTEFATDMMFRDEASLAAWYSQFVHHGIRSFGSADVLRFLGSARPNNFQGEVTSTLKRRPEGVRLKHVVNGNSLKVYDKQGSVPRVETTIVNPHPFGEQLQQDPFRRFRSLVGTARAARLEVFKASSLQKSRAPFVTGLAADSEGSAQSGKIGFLHFKHGDELFPAFGLVFGVPGHGPRA